MAAPWIDPCSRPSQLNTQHYTVRVHPSMACDCEIVTHQSVAYKYTAAQQPLAKASINSRMSLDQGWSCTMQPLTVAATESDLQQHIRALQCTAVPPHQ